MIHLREKNFEDDAARVAHLLVRYEAMRVKKAPHP